jgi:hypothetical protein
VYRLQTCRLCCGKSHGFPEDGRIIFFYCSVAGKSAIILDAMPQPLNPGADAL